MGIPVDGVSIMDIASRGRRVIDAAAPSAPAATATPAQAIAITTSTPCPALPPRSMASWQYSAAGASEGAASSTASKYSTAPSRSPAKYRSSPVR
jgi:hypothetical protein